MNKWLLIAPLLIAGPLMAGAPIITPSTTSVYVKGQVQFTSTDTVTWSLRSGSTGTITAGGLYTAPDSLFAKNVVDGCPMFPNDHIYNTRIDTLPIDSNNATRLANFIGGTTVYMAFEVSFPNNILSSGTPTQSTTFYYTDAQNGFFPIVAFPYTGVEHSANSVVNSPSVDRHILGVSTNTCQIVEQYKLYPAGYNGDCLTCTAQSGVKADAFSYQLSGASVTNHGTTDAAGLFIQPLALRYSELSSKDDIQHALRFTLANGYIFSGLLWPARNYTNQCSNFSQCYPYGSRWRLKSTFNEAPFSAQGKKILRALKRYGMFLSDGGTTMHLQTMADVVADTTTWNTIFVEFGAIGGTSRPGQYDFEMVDESSLMVSSASGHVNLNNSYVVPDNYAEVIATKTADSSTASVRIAIIPVTAGVGDPVWQAHSGKGIAVMAGAPGFQIPYWVKGASTTGATCSMTSATGTLTSGCFYTPPGSLVNLSTTVITLVPTADSTGTIRFPLIVYPSDGIRYNVGGKAGTISSPVIPYDANNNYGPDVNGKYWWSDPPGTVPSWFSVDDVSFPQASWPASSDIGLFYTRRGGDSDDAFSAIVPNGDYRLTLGLADDTSLAAVDYTVDTQGVVVVSSSSVSNYVSGGSAYTPGTLTFDVSVTNNYFYFAIRMLNETSSYASLNMWSLIPRRVLGASTTNGTRNIRTTPGSKGVSTR